MYFFRFFYTLVLVCIAPFFLFGLYKKKPNKPSVGPRWKEHFGITPQLEDREENDEVVWIHAVSVGETLAVTPFVKELHRRYPDKKIVITTTTPTGAEQAKKLSVYAEHRYMPLDFPFAIKGFINSIHPTQLIIMETELWPNLLTIASQNKINVSVINSRLSEKSYHGYKRFKPFIKICLENINHICCQYNEDKKHFALLGAQKQQLSVTGSIKYDIQISTEVKKQSSQLRKLIGINRPVWIAASTHAGEDEIIFESHQKLLEKQPGALLIIVPRHPERFDSVHHLSVKMGLNTRRRTEEATDFNTIQVYLADTMGEMLLLLGAADVCFMGGSLLGKTVGGHNVLEPAALGIPTIIGPSYYNFLDITLALKEANALEVVEKNEKIYQSVLKILTNVEYRHHMSNNAKRVVSQNTGSIDKTINQIFH